jgi:hypothetical protein
MKRDAVEDEEERLNNMLIAVDSSPAHIVGTVEGHLGGGEVGDESSEKVPGYGHLLCLCKLRRAYVQRAYWDGKTLGPLGGAPSLLSFLGSGQFSHVRRLSPRRPSPGGPSTPAGSEPTVAISAGGDHGAGSKLGQGVVGSGVGSAAPRNVPPLGEVRHANGEESIAL